MQLCGLENALDSELIHPSWTNMFSCGGGYGSCFFCGVYQWDHSFWTHVYTQYTRTLWPLSGLLYVLEYFTINCSVQKKLNPDTPMLTVFNVLCNSEVKKCKVLKCKTHTRPSTSLGQPWEQNIPDFDWNAPVFSWATPALLLVCCLLVLKIITLWLRFFFFFYAPSKEQDQFRCNCFLPSIWKCGFLKITYMTTS